MFKDTIKHIFFDLDHTLWDFDKNSALAYQRIFEKYNIEIPLLDFLAVYVPINLKYWKLYREGQMDTQTLRRGRLMDTFDHFAVDFSRTQIDAIADKYIEYLPENTFLIKGALALLAYLAPRYSLHIITNGFRAVQARKLESSNIRHFFETITDSEAVGVKKPDPRIFEHALQVAKAARSESLMIGDNFEADILGASKIGLKTICFNYHKETIPNIFTQVDDLIAIKSYL